MKSDGTADQTRRSFFLQSKADQRKHPRRKPLASQRDLTLVWISPQGPRTDSSVRVVDISMGGLQVELHTALDTGQTVTVKGEIDNALGRQPLDQRCKVMRCTPLGGNRHLIGLAYQGPAGEPPKNGSAAGSTAAAASPAGDLDYYEILQVNPKADNETIHRVYHFLALRYHPDNQETGNPELFHQIAQAHEILSDASRRAAHDVELAGRDSNRFRIFESWQSSRGMEAERRKRQGILGLLYAKRTADVQHSSMSLQELEKLLECPREHLEFSLWFLREKKLVTRADNSRFEITCHGVEAVEAEEVPVLQAIPQLPAASIRG
ncbi:MAG TPA: DnaJ domain-containing protein [Bryobacteraceae bacterium]|jgi:hypothetical protein|nr:DnaJ domain-containing protein [Bryobacteraceae bacterium]